MSTQTKQQGSIVTQVTNIVDTVRLNFSWRWVTGITVAGIILFLVWNLSAWFHYESVGYFAPLATSGTVATETAQMLAMAFIAGFFAALTVLRSSGK